jgi:hypothetical protein
MRVQWTKISDITHGLVVVRTDGSTDAVELNSRSFLAHDFSHFAIEQCAQIGCGFWGNIAAGVAFADVAAVGAATPEDGLFWRAEKLSAPFQTLWRFRSAPEFRERCARYSVAVDVDAAFVAGALDVMRSLFGEWQKVPYGASMERVWPSDLTTVR